LFTALAFSLKPIFCPVRILRRMVDNFATMLRSWVSFTCSSCTSVRPVL
jgi:hypothetical protein